MRFLSISGVVVAGLALASSNAFAQVGIVNQMMNSAIQMQQQQQAIEAQRRAQEGAQRSREAASERERQAQQKKQAAEKAEADRQAAFERIRPAAEQMIEEVSDFIKSNPAQPNVLSYAEGVAGLGKALKASDPSAVEKRMAALNTQVQKDPAFAAFAQKRAEQRREQNARELVEIVKTAEAQKQFALGFIAQNPTANSVEQLLPLAKALGEALQRPTYEVLKPLTGQVDAAFRQAGLRAAYLNSLATSAPATAPAAAPAVGTAANATSTDGFKESLTDKNRFLLEGNVDDVVFLYNSSGNSPHVLKNLKGDIVFEKSAADVCIFPPSTDASGARIARSALAPYGLETISVDAKPCSPERLKALDVVMVQRASLFRGAPGDARELLRQVEIGTFRQLFTLSAADLAAKKERARALAATINEQSRSGFGLVLLDNSSSVICAIVTDDLAAHELLLMKQKQLIRSEINASPVVQATTLDSAFSGVKRNKCAAVYASSENLKVLVDAFDRDGTGYRLSEVWFDPADISQAKESIAQEQARLYERQRAAAEAAALALQRAESEAREKDAVRARLRAENGPKAEAAASTIGNEVKSALNAPGDWARVAYPSFFAWMDEKLADKWEVFSINTGLSDYGTVEWKGRSLELGASQVDIRLRNRFLGEYKDYCFVFIKLFDYEFQMSRDPAVFSCENVRKISAWKASRQFKSLWTVE